MNTPQVGTKRMPRPSKLSTFRSACEQRVLSMLGSPGEAARPRLHSWPASTARLESVLQSQQLLRHNTQHLHINAVELIEASPCPLHSQFCVSTPCMDVSPLPGACVASKELKSVPPSGPAPEKKRPSSL